MAAGRSLLRIHKYCKIHKDVSKQNYPSEVDSSLEVNHRESHTPRETFKTNNMNRNSAVTKTENVHYTMM
jgi:hypothetical protein